VTLNNNSMDGAMQRSHLPNNSLELLCVLCHPAFPRTLAMAARLFATSNSVSEVAAAALISQVLELDLKMTSSSEARQAAAWMLKHPGVLQGLQTLKLQLDREASWIGRVTAGQQAQGSVPCSEHAVTACLQESLALPAQLQREQQQQCYRICPGRLLT
jgi:hypothetical protein